MHDLPLEPAWIQNDNSLNGNAAQALRPRSEQVRKGEATLACWPVGAGTTDKRRGSQGASSRELLNLQMLLDRSIWEVNDQHQGSLWLKDSDQLVRNQQGYVFSPPQDCSPVVPNPLANNKESFSLNDDDDDVEDGAEPTVSSRCMQQSGCNDPTATQRPAGRSPVNVAAGGAQPTHGTGMQQQQQSGQKRVGGPISGHPSASKRHRAAMLNPIHAHSDDVSSVGPHQLGLQDALTHAARRDAPAAGVAMPCPCTVRLEAHGSEMITDLQLELEICGPKLPGVAVQMGPWTHCNH